MNYSTVNVQLVIAIYEIKINFEFYDFSNKKFVKNQYRCSFVEIKGKEK